MSWKRYEKYQDSGVEWLGEVPEGWNVNRMKYLCNINPTKSEISHLSDDLEVSFLPMEKINEDHTLTLDKNQKLSEVWNGYTYFRDNDIILAKITPCFENGKCCLCSGLTNKIGFGTTELHVLRPKSKILSRFCFYLLQSHSFRGIGKELMFGTAGQKRLPEDFIADYKQGIPSLPEQTAIAAFLDRETTRIDALIEKKERLIALLEEKRAGLISHAVTKGLDPSVPMKDSGMEWVGNIPSHWRVLKTKYLFKLIADYAPENNGYELLSIYTDIGVRPRKELEQRGNKATTTDGYLIVKKGDIIVNKLLAWMGAIGYSKYDGVTSPAYDILRKQKLLNSKFYHYLFRCGIYQPEFQRRSRGIMEMRWRLYFDQFGQIPLPYPPEKEQNDIVDFLENETVRINALIGMIEDSIKKIIEYRSTLISTAVTGKIDLRQEAIR
jgi:type I restriction enzyme S subunit